MNEANQKNSEQYDVQFKLPNQNDQLNNQEKLEFINFENLFKMLFDDNKINEESSEKIKEMPQEIGKIQAAFGGQETREENGVVKTIIKILVRNQQDMNKLIGYINGLELKSKDGNDLKITAYSGKQITNEEAKDQAKQIMKESNLIVKGGEGNNNTLYQAQDKKLDQHQQEENQKDNFANKMVNQR